MQVISPNQTKLISALIEGAFEVPLWSTFLSLLREETQADFVTLHFRPPGRPMDEMINLCSAGEESVDLQSIYFEHIYPAPPPFNEALLEGQAYNKHELLQAETDGSIKRLSREYLNAHQIKGFLQMRVQEASGVYAWIGLTSRVLEFSCSHKELLESLAPILRATLRTYVAFEKERYHARATADAAGRLHFGWLMLDASGCVIDSDVNADSIVTESKVLFLNETSHKLATKNKELNTRLKEAIRQVADKTNPRPRAISLSRDPWLDMLLVPAAQTSISVPAKPEVIAYLHGDNWNAEDRTEQLSELFSLTVREAQLALAFCRGLNVEEAAEAYELKLETVRNYSKRIYARLGVRGMPDLIRLMMRSLLVM